MLADAAVDAKLIDGVRAADEKMIDRLREDLEKVQLRDWADLDR